MEKQYVVVDDMGQLAMKIDTHRIEDMVLGELSALLRTLPARLSKNMQAEVIRICNEVEAERANYSEGTESFDASKRGWAYGELRRRLGAEKEAEL